jgi:hypothetical protein
MESNIYCSRCGRRLAPGGTRYVVTINVTADFDGYLGPGPGVGEVDFDEVFRMAADKSEDELINEVAQKLSFWLCKPCRDEWVEEPLGREAAGPGSRGGQMH